jgi:uridylate kinase
MEKEWIVLSVGGSLLNDGKPNVQMACALAKIFDSTGKNMAIVVGGGKEARAASDSARKKFGNEFDADLAGIKITRKNANVLRKALGSSAGKKIFEDFEEARAACKKQKYVLMGGTIPGITTDADAALLAEAIGEKKLVNMSKTAIFDSDPSKNANAKKFDILTHAQLLQVAQKSDQRMAGTHFIFDLLACTLIARSKIETHFIDGRDESDVKNAILGKRHNGSIVK